MTAAGQNGEIWFGPRLKNLEESMKPKNFSQRKTQAAGWEINVSSYQLGDKFYCTVDNVSPGVWIAKTEGASREEAEKKALERAAELLSRTRRVKVSAKA